MRVKIETTQSDIDNGTPSRVESCPIALACKRAGLINPEVCEGEISLISKDRCDSIDIAADTNGFVYAFDRGNEVRPFSFWLDVPRKYLNLRVVAARRAWHKRRQRLKGIKATPIATSAPLPNAEVKRLANQKVKLFA